MTGKVKILLRRGACGVMAVEVRAGAAVTFEDSGGSYDGIPEKVASIRGPGEYRVREWCVNDFFWGEWKPIGLDPTTAHKEGAETSPKSWITMTEAEKETERYRDLSRSLKEDLIHCREALRKVQDLASWHYDEDAIVEDLSPEDMTAHVNGLIVRLCAEELGKDPTAAPSGQNGRG